MTLDPVHVDGIADLASALAAGVDETAQRDVASEVWADFLDPLYDGEDAVLEPLGEQGRFVVSTADAALDERPFPSQHGLDAGTINPTTFTNGLVLDVAQAAMAAEPSDLDLHRSRHLVAAVHTNDPTAHLDQDWRKLDDGNARRCALRVPRVDRYEQDVVHALALYLAESTHARAHLDTVEDLLVLDGPIYPAGILQWAEHDPHLADLLVEDDVRDVLANYVRLVEETADRDLPLIGFVKSTTSSAITSVVRERRGMAPWANDAAFFRQVLRPVTIAAEAEGIGDDAAGLAGDEGFDADTAESIGADDTANDDPTDALACTNWFRSTVGIDAHMSASSDAFDVGRERDPADYEVTFFAIYDPRTDVIYRVEAPAVVTRDPERREDIRRQVLADVAAERGPPPAIRKADELARIGASEKASLRDEIERRIGSDRQRGYDEERWGRPGSRDF